MKYILTALLLCVSSFCFSQDTLHIPSPELEEFFLALDTLEVQDSINRPIVGVTAGVLGTVLLIQALDYTLPQ